MNKMQKQVLTVNDIAIIMDMTPRKVRENEKKFGLDKARVRVAGKFIRYKRSVIETLEAFRGVKLPS